MSQKKIRNPNRKRKTAASHPVDMRTASFSHLNICRAEERDAEETKVAEMIDSGELDVGSRFNRKYMEERAKSIGWKAGRLERTIERMVMRMKAIEAAIKQANKSKEQKDEQPSV